MVYGYARVSTKKQSIKGNSLEDQAQALKAQGCEVIFSEAYTGKKIDRPEFTRLLAVLKPGDTIIVTKLDRFARTATEGAQKVQELLSKGVSVNILNMGKADNTPMGKLVLQVMFAFAEFERDMICERTQAGREWNRENNPDYREGRKPVTVDPDDPHIQAYLAHTLSAKDCYTALHISKNTFYKIIHQIGGNDDEKRPHS